MPKSTSKLRRRKLTDRPSKPYPEHPLRPARATGAKKSGAKNKSFGAWGKRENGKLVVLPDGGNWKPALAKYKAEVDDLNAGRVPRPAEQNAEGVTVAYVFNQFIASKVVKNIRP